MQFIDRLANWTRSNLWDNETTQKKNLNTYSRYPSTNKIKWIEKLLQTPIEDYRKYCIWRILLPCLANIIVLSHEEIIRTVKDWLHKCDQLNNLAFNPDILIKNNLKYIKEYPPIAREKLKQSQPHLYRRLTGLDVFNDW